MNILPRDDQWFWIPLSINLKLNPLTIRPFRDLSQVDFGGRRKKVKQTQGMSGWILVVTGTATDINSLRWVLWIGIGSLFWYWYLSHSQYRDKYSMGIASIWFVFTFDKAFFCRLNNRHFCRCLCARVGRRKCLAPLTLEPSMPTPLPQLASRGEANGGLRWLNRDLKWMNLILGISFLFLNLQAVRAKVDSNPVGALQELCQKVKVVPFYEEVVGAPRHTVQVTASPVLWVSHLKTRHFSCDLV